MSRPVLLDLYCKAGGAAMGYYRAGFDVVGVDHEPQPRYPFHFILADALDYLAAHGHEYAAIHASPPCQRHTSLRWMHNAKEHADLIPPTRDLLRVSGRPYIIENVPGAPLRDAVTLCGTMFGLGSGDAELRRHRLFELSSPAPLTPRCQHGERTRVIGVYGGHGRDRRRTVNTLDFPADARREAMGITWMTDAELSQAIPPAYCEFIGRWLLSYLNEREERTA
jgi:DNA (cytosine-5)-methyltransferase 1